MKKETLAKLFIVIISGVLLLSAAPARGDAAVYWDFDNGFDPYTVVIGPGESVTWWNTDVYGFDTQVTFYYKNVNFDLPYNGAPYGLIFNVPAGVYGYYNQWGNNGSVIVNVAPAVAITAPADGVVFPAPATFTVEATAGDTADDSISDVEFFLGTGDGTNSIEDVFSAPYSTGLTNLDAGTYTLLAVARDSRGWTATNAVTVTVTGGAGISLGSPRIEAGQFLFDVTGLTAGKTNIIQASTDFASWSPVETNIAASASMTVTNAAVLAEQFYRVLQLP